MDEKLIFSNDEQTMVDSAAEEYSKDLDYVREFSTDMIPVVLRNIGVKLDENQDDLDALLVEKFDFNNKAHVDVLKDAIREDLYADSGFFADQMDGEYKSFQENLKKIGLLKKDNEHYLFFGSNMGWRHRSGFAMKEISEAEDVVNAMHGDYDYTAEIYAKKGQPYLTARFSSHDAPTGEFYTMVPESWIAEAMKCPEIASKIRDVMRDDIDIRDIASQYLPEMQGDNMALAGIKYAIIDEVDRLGNPKNILEEMKCIAANLAVLDRKEFEAVVRDTVANGNGAESNVLEYLYGDEITPFYKDFQEETEAFSYQLPEEPFDKNLANGILKVMQTKNEDTIGKMVDGLFGENREKEIKSLKKLGKEMAAGR